MMKLLSRFDTKYVHILIYTQMHCGHLGGNGGKNLGLNLTEILMYSVSIYSKLPLYRTRL